MRPPRTKCSIAMVETNAYDNCKQIAMRVADTKVRLILPLWFYRCSIFFHLNFVTISLFTTAENGKNHGFTEGGDLWAAEKALKDVGR